MARVLGNFWSQWHTEDHYEHDEEMYLFVEWQTGLYGVHFNQLSLELLHSVYP
jgi:hypothetical protein